MLILERTCLYFQETSPPIFRDTSFCQKKYGLSSGTSAAHGRITFRKTCRWDPSKVRWLSWKKYDGMTFSVVEARYIEYLQQVRLSDCGPTKQPAIIFAVYFCIDDKKSLPVREKSVLSSENICLTFNRHITYTWDLRDRSMITLFTRSYRTFFPTNALIDIKGSLEMHFELRRLHGAFSAVDS